MRALRIEKSVQPKLSKLQRQLAEKKLNNPEADLSYNRLYLDKENGTEKSDALVRQVNQLLDKIEDATTELCDFIATRSEEASVGIGGKISEILKNPFARDIMDYGKLLCIKKATDVGLFDEDVAEALEQGIIAHSKRGESQPTEQDLPLE
jgi:hypothetical protein